MNEETKNTLDYINEFMNAPLEHIYLNKKRIKLLLDYITNLQSQLEQKEKQLNDIKEYIKELSDNTDDTTCYEIDRHTKQELMLFLIGDKIDDLYNKIIERNNSNENSD